MGRLLLLLLLLVVSWTAAEVREKKHLTFKVDHMWKSLNEWIPKRTDLPRNYTGCGDCDKVTTGIGAKNIANDGIGNKTSIEGPNVVQFMQKVTTEQFARDMLTTDRQKKMDSVLKAKGDEKMVAGNLIPRHELGRSRATRKFSKDEKAPVVELRLLENKTVMPLTGSEKTNAPSRRHKAFYMTYPSSQRVYQGKEEKQDVSVTTKKQKQKPSKHKAESNVYFIRLPPAPYSYVPGLGYVSQPATFSTSSLAAASKQPQRYRQPQSPFIKLPLEFVSNGKPTAVYRWSPSTTADAHHHHHHQQQQQQQQQQQHQHHQQQQQHNRRPPAKGDSAVIMLDRGPYVFNGRPTSVYLMKRNPRPAAPNRI